MAALANKILQDDQNLRSFRLEPHYSIKQIATSLNIHHRTVYAAITSGKLIAVSAGGQWRVSQTALDVFLSAKPFNHGDDSSRDALRRGRKALLARRKAA